MSGRDTHKRVIAVDIDDVVVPLAHPAVAFVRGRTGIAVTVAEFYDGNPDGHTPSGLANRTFSVLTQEFVRTKGAQSRPPIVGAENALNQLSGAYDIQFVTSRDVSLIELTRRWFEKYMQGLAFSPSIHFLGNVYVGGETKTKAEYCDEVWAAYFIDDQIRYVEQFNHSSTVAILFGDYLWDSGVSTQHCVRAEDWDEVLRIIKV